MALVLGTNCGFVTVAPTEDPNGGTFVNGDNAGMTFLVTSPATAIKITEIGWYCDNATEAANFRAGLYDDDGAVVPGEAGTRIYLSSDVAKGTDAGWKRATVDWIISPSTVYWLAIGLDDTATATKIDRESSGGPGVDVQFEKNTLPNPFGGGSVFDSDGLIAIYAIYEAAPPAPEVDNYPVQTGSVNIRKKDTLSQRAYLSRGVT